MPSWTTERGMEVPDAPTGDAGLRLKQNFVWKAGTNQTSSDPTVSSDSTQNYYVGSRWLNTATKLLWICVDNTASAAIWVPAFRLASGALQVDDTLVVNVPAAADRGLAIKAKASQTGYLLELQDSSGSKLSGVGPDGEFNCGPATTLTIASGAVTAAKSYHKIETEGGAGTDDLDTINGGVEGDVLAIRPTNSSHVVVAKNATGNLRLNGDYTMNSVNAVLTLLYDGTNWLELSRTVTAGGSGTIDVYENGSSVVAATRLDFKDLNAENPSGSIAALYLDLPRICDGRLTLTSATPVTSADVLSTTLYWTPYFGAKVSLYDGTRWKLHAFSERSITNSGLSASTNYDAFVYDNSGTLTIELVAWSTATARATAIVLQDGVYVKSGATTRRYLGTLRTVDDGGTVKFADEEARRFSWNHYHRSSRPLYKTDTADVWSYATQSWRAGNNSTSNRVEVVAGLEDAYLNLTLNVFINNTTISDGGIIAIGEDSTTSPITNQIRSPCLSVPANDISTSPALVSKFVPLGYHYYQWLERCVSGGTAYFRGDSGLTGVSACGLCGFVEG